MPRTQGAFTSMKLGLVTVTILLLTTATALAQSGPSGTLTGVVQDPNGVIVCEASYCLTGCISTLSLMSVTEC